MDSEPGQLQYQYPQFLLYGDSLVQSSVEPRDGWAFTAALQHDYSRRMDVVNRGFSGYNSKQAVEFLPAVLRSLASGPIRFTLILFGSNDACLPVTTGQHVPLQEYKTNLKSLIMHPGISGSKIILVTPPPIDEALHEETDMANGYLYITRKASITAKYAAIVREVGNEHDILVVDLWTRFMDEAIKNTPGHVSDQGMIGSKELGSNNVLADLLSDGLHLTGRGYKVFYKELKERMQQKWPDELPEKLPFVFPSWRDLLAK